MSLSHDLHQLLPYYGITVHETRDTTHHKRERYGCTNETLVFAAIHTVVVRFPKGKAQLSL